jgi:hypothetical protein
MKKAGRPHNIFNAVDFTPVIWSETKTCRKILQHLREKEKCCIFGWATKVFINPLFDHHSYDANDGFGFSVHAPYLGVTICMHACSYMTLASLVRKRDGSHAGGWAGRCNDATFLLLAKVISLYPERQCEGCHDAPVTRSQPVRPCFVRHTCYHDKYIRVNKLDLAIVVGLSLH